MKTHGSIAGRPRIQMLTCSMFRRMITPTGQIVSARLRQKPRSFTNKRSSSIRILLSLLPVSRQLKAGCITRYEPTAVRRENARRNADEALRLQPDLPEGHLALGYSYYYGDRDYQRALTEFEIAKRDLPNEADAYSAIAAIQRRQGKWAESTANFEKSTSLDPKNASVLLNFAHQLHGSARL